MSIVPDRPVILHTTPDLFAKWLERLTWNVWTHRYRDGERWVTIDRARARMEPTNDGSVVCEMMGFWHHLRMDEALGEVDCLEGLPRAFVTFHAVPVSPDRIQAFSTCSEPVLSPLIDAIWAGIAATWPESGLSAPGSQDCDTLAKMPRLPKRQADLLKWKRVWLLIHGRLHRDNIKTISAWLRQTHGDLPRSRETLGQIIAAGRAGLLD
jgi:hypothetical protein